MGRPLTRQERSYFNALLASVPMGRPYQLVEVHESGITRLASADSVGALMVGKPGVGKKIMVVNKNEMTIEWEKEGPPLRVPLPYSYSA